MPPPALANLLWLGREHLLCQKASLGTRLLSCLGRPVWRKLILGKGDKDEQESGIGGNCILLAQARPEELVAALPPTTEQLQESFVVLFARSLEEVSRAQMLVVNRQDYVELVSTRRRVCPVYADIPLDAERTRQWPENGVPEELLACAQQLPETDRVCIASVGPASRPVDVACDAHSAAKPDATHEAEEEEWEQLEQETLEAAKPTDAERERQAFETNTAEDVIAVDHSNDPGLLETFAAFQTKLVALNEAAERVFAVQRHHEEEAKSSVDTPAVAPEEKAENSVDTAAVDSSVMAAVATAAAKEQCRTLVLETQELAKKLTKPELKRMAESFAQNAEACVSTSGAPLSMLSAETWPKCFVEFFYGDALPNVTQRGAKGAGAVHVSMGELFAWLQDREELEYALRSDAVPYKARATSRFDTPECTAIFGSVLRHLLILRGVGTVFRRQGYEADLKMIAQASAEDCVAALCSRPKTKESTGAQEASAAKPERQRALDQLAYAPDVPENLRKALRQVLFATVKVPFTDGYRRKLRHEGHNLNAVHGPLKLFVTANFADVYSPVMLSMLLCNSAGNPVAEPIEVSGADLAAQCPEMPPLREMHRLVAASPRTQAKF